MGQLLHGERLTGVHPSLINVVKKAVAKVPFDVTVIEGVRSDEQCYINFGKGRTPAECIKGNCPAKYSNPNVAKVTWLNHALSCNHRKKPDGFGHAVDLFPGTWDVKTGGPYDQMKVAMFEAAKEAGVKLRWGADWNQNGKCREHGETDNPHFELV
jgi:peptidoglycan L-alanyl-D-glutamate endopeptidase CwlK